MSKAKASIQVVGFDEFTGEVTPSTSSYAKYRLMRRDPTIALARWFSVAPTLSAGWTVQGDDEDQVAFIDEILTPMRTYIMRTALYGHTDYGWKAYEKVFDQREVGTHGLRTVLAKLIALRNDNTRVVYSKDHVFLGIIHDQVVGGEKIHIDADHSLFINFDDEGTGDYGLSKMAVAEAPYDAWCETEASAQRFDAKVAGVHWVVYYPIGFSLFGGVETDNSDIATTILNALISSGGVKIPVDLSNLVDGLGSGWKIEQLTATNVQAGFIEREKYLDSQKIRAFGVTERSIVEGQFGTKAEAGEHADAALVIQEIRHAEILEILNWHLVDQLTDINYGERGVVHLAPVPLSDERKAIFKTVFMQMLTQPDGVSAVLDRLNVEEIVDVLKLPLLEEDIVDNIELPTITTTESSRLPIPTLMQELLGNATNN